MSMQVKLSTVWKRKWAYYHSSVIRKHTNSPQLHMEFGLLIYKELNSKELYYSVAICIGNL